MRQRRAKTYRKLVSLYVRHFGFRAPLQLLVDAALLTSLAHQRVDVEQLASRLADVLQVNAALPGARSNVLGPPTSGRASGSRGRNEAGAAGSGVRGGGADRRGGTVTPGGQAGVDKGVRIMVTQCCIVELYKSEKEGEAQKRAVALAKGVERRKCNHKEPLSGDECLKSMLGTNNKFRYVLVANSAALRAHVRHNLVGVPVVHTNETGVLVIEPMSQATQQRVRQLENDKLGLSPAEAAELGLVGPRQLQVAAQRPPGGGDDGGDGETPAGASSVHIVDRPAASSSRGPGAEVSAGDALFIPQRRKRRGPKEPNPLSVKKPKKPKQTGAAGLKPTTTAKAKGNSAATSPTGLTPGTREKDVANKARQGDTGGGSSGKARTEVAGDASKAPDVGQLSSSVAGKKRKREAADQPGTGVRVGSGGRASADLPARRGGAESTASGGDGSAESTRRAAKTRGKGDGGDGSAPTPSGDPKNRHPRRGKRGGAKRSSSSAKSATAATQAGVGVEA